MLFPKLCPLSYTPDNYFRHFPLILNLQYPLPSPLLAHDLTFDFPEKLKEKRPSPNSHCFCPFPYPKAKMILLNPPLHLCPFFLSEAKPPTCADPIFSCPLKDIASAIVPSLQYYQFSLPTGLFPSANKHAIVPPTLKKFPVLIFPSVTTEGLFICS